MKDLIIVGVSSFAKLLYTYLCECDKRDVVAFTVNKKYITQGETEFCGKPLVPLEKIQEIYSPELFDIMMGIGHSKMNQVRQRLFVECKRKGYFIASFIHPSVYISKNAKLGEGNIILEMSSIAPFVKIGNGNLLWDHVQLAHEDVLGNYNTISGGCGISGASEVGNNCYLGKHSMVFDHVKISDFTLLGAGAYIKHDSQPYDVIVPAQSITLKGKQSIEFL